MVIRAYDATVSSKPIYMRIPIYQVPNSMFDYSVSWDRIYEYILYYNFLLKIVAAANPLTG